MPIQTRMVKESMLTKEEKAWLKVRFNPFKLSKGEVTNTAFECRNIISVAWKSLLRF